MSNSSPAAAEPPRRRTTPGHRRGPFPGAVIYILLFLFGASLAFSLFILAVVHNAIFFLIFLLLSSLVLGFVVWNKRGFSGGGVFCCFVSRLSESDLRTAKEGQLVKVTGIVSCGNISLESSYEKVPRCIFTSTRLYECRRSGSRFSFLCSKLLKCNLVYTERISTDFYIADVNSGMRAWVKAGNDAKVIPLVTESTLVYASSKSTELSSYLKKWLGERHIRGESRMMKLEEGYIKEGNHVTVIGLFNKVDGVSTIVQPPQLYSTGCLWAKLFLPVDVDGLIIRLSDKSNSSLASYN